MAANFPIWWTQICQLPSNDGNANDTAPGGAETHWGFQYPTFTDARFYCGFRTATMADFNAMSATQAAFLGEQFFWNRLQGPALPAGADLMVVDWCFGSGGAPREIQRHIGMAPSQIDGLIGPITARAIGAYGPNFIPDSYQWRIDYYNSLADHSQYPGWYTRAALCQQIALQLAGAPNR